MAKKVIGGVASSKSKKVRATKSNAGISAWYQKRLDNLIQRMGKHVMKNVKNSWAKSATQMQTILNRLSNQWESEFDDKAKDIADGFVKRVDIATTSSMKQALKESGMTVKFQKTRHVQKVMTSIRDSQVSLITSIPKQFIDKVAGVVQRGVQNGRDFKYIERQLLKLSDYTPRRARMIAIDQCNKATEAIKMTRDESLGIKQGIWIHIGGRYSSRETHKEMDGKVFNLRGAKAGLYDRNVKERVMPAQLPNCACTYQPIIPEVLNG